MARPARGRVWVKVIGKAASKLSLSMRDVDQQTGHDNRPMTVESQVGLRRPLLMVLISGGLRGAGSAARCNTLSSADCRGWAKDA